MDQTNIERLVGLAFYDIESGDTRRAKDRLRTVLQHSPHYVHALELMGLIYYQHGDYRNAVMNWSRARYWDEPMPHACERVFRSIRKALVKEKPRVVRYQLYSFAGNSPPGEFGDDLYTLQSAYYKLGSKRAKLTGLACAPLSGGCLLVVLGLISMMLGGGWSSFQWLGALAVIATLTVAIINIYAYLRASRLFQEAIEPFRKPSDTLLVTNPQQDEFGQTVSE